MIAAAASSRRLVVPPAAQLAVGARRARGRSRGRPLCDQLHDARHVAGAAGVISVTSNVIPRVFASLMETRDDELNASVQPLIAWMFREPNPTGLNTMLSMMGACKPVFRMPYMPYEKAEREEGLKLLEALGGAEVAPSCRNLRLMEDDDFEYVYRF